MLVSIDVRIPIVSKNIIIYLGLFCLSSVVHAQTTGGVFPPMVTAGYESLQYRIGVDPENAKGETGVTQRIHYINGLTDDFKWVVFAGVRRTDSSNYDFDYLHTALSWDLGEDGQKYRTGFRVDLRLGGGNRPDHVGLVWMNHFNLSDSWTARAVIMNTVQFGEDASDGVNLHTRSQVAKRMKSGHSLGLEVWNFFGKIDDLGGFDSQNHSLGPIYNIPLKSGWSVFSGILFGISEAAPDTQYRLWISRTL